jgi:cyclopropane fatty-acyl-phospholipid synthase-like methyltransferase
MKFIFDGPVYDAARDSRMRNLFRHLDFASLAGQRILEVGCGTGELGQVFVEAGSYVVSIDARTEYILELRRRFPDREAHVVNLEHWNPGSLGRFDAVLCFGLLYHLSTPAEFLGVCTTVAPVVFLETVVSDSPGAVCPLVSEAGSDQAWSGTGCRPSPAWLHECMSKLGCDLRDISASEANWSGSVPSVFDWIPQGDGQWQRGGALLRKMMIATRRD